MEHERQKFNSVHNESLQSGVVLDPVGFKTIDKNMNKWWENKIFLHKQPIYI